MSNFIVSGYFREKARFLPVDFANRGIDAINICNVLHHKEVTFKIPIKISLFLSYPTVTPKPLHLKYLTIHKHCRTLT